MSTPDEQQKAADFVLAELRGEGVDIAPEVVAGAATTVEAMSFAHAVPPPPGHTFKAQASCRVNASPVVTKKAKTVAFPRGFRKGKAAHLKGQWGKDYRLKKVLFLRTKLGRVVAQRVVQNVVKNHESGLDQTVKK